MTKILIDLEFVITIKHNDFNDKTPKSFIRILDFTLFSKSFSPDSCDIPAQFVSSECDRATNPELFPTLTCWQCQRERLPKDEKCYRVQAVVTIRLNNLFSWSWLESG